MNIEIEKKKRGTNTTHLKNKKRKQGAEITYEKREREVHLDDEQNRK